jgi:hypothetical protein
MKLGAKSLYKLICEGKNTCGFAQSVIYHGFRVSQLKIKFC